MRIPHSRLTILRLMIVVAAMAIGCAMLVPKLGPMFGPRPRLAVAGSLVATADILMWTTGR